MRSRCSRTCHGAWSVCRSGSTAPPRSSAARRRRRSRVTRGTRRVVPQSVSRSSLLRMPAADLKISVIGQYVMPSPYERHRPQWTLQRSSSRRTSSCSRRLLPMPGEPTMVAMPGAALVQHSGAEAFELGELRLPSDERRLAARPRGGAVARGDDLPDRHGLALALRLHGLGLAELERVLRSEVGQRGRPGSRPSARPTGFSRPC